jgi:hypothetical protein
MFVNCFGNLEIEVIHTQVSDGFYLFSESVGLMPPNSVIVALTSSMYVKCAVSES